jgi:putative phosphoesterase
MRIGIVSDTHGQVEFALQAVRLLESLEIALVVHCGDVGSAEVVRVFAAWPCHYVLGNVDDERTLPAAIAAAGQKCHGRFGSLLLEGRKLAWLHGDDEPLLDRTIACGAWDLVCHGHTHVPRCERLGRTLVLNPGALYRARRHTVAIVELPSLEAAVLDV